jgi:hypothetical protein
MKRMDLRTYTASSLYRGYHVFFARGRPSYRTTVTDWNFYFLFKVRFIAYVPSVRSNNVASESKHHTGYVV